MNNYYLVVEDTIFVDPHGEGDDGGTEKRIEYTDEYNDLDLSKLYDDELQEIDDDEEYQGSEDGCNMTYVSIKITKVSETRANEIRGIIKAYNKL
jgi:hypothetical protein